MLGGIEIKPNYSDCGLYFVLFPALLAFSAQIVQYDLGEYGNDSAKDDRDKCQHDSEPPCDPIQGRVEAAVQGQRRMLS